MQFTRPFILASASPRRAELLTQIGIDFTVLASHIDEPPPTPDEDVRAWAQRAAADKARATAALLPSSSSALVLGADTVVLLPVDAPQAPQLAEQPVAVLGKPRDRDNARRMLAALSGRGHVVLSAFALLAHPEGDVVTEAVETCVRFRTLTACEIEEYLATGEPLDKAGAYGIQGFGAVLVESIHGDYYTVVGLPLARLWEMLEPWRA